MKRREFFKLGAQKAAEITAEVVKAKAGLRAADWLRPPFALPEDEFLSGCTRCDGCISACPHDVLFKLPARLGDRVADTPALDLGNRGCHMCEDWPCVVACEPNALARPEPEEGDDPVLPKLAHLAINEGTCLPYAGPECGACAHACPLPGALTWPDGLRPFINVAACTGCALCREACIVDPKAIDIRAPSSGGAMSNAGTV